VRGMQRSLDMLKSKMIKRECDGPGCGDRRVHWERPYNPRGAIMVEVPEDYQGKVFCSIECQVYYDASNKLEREDEPLILG
jgi:hypothetical protein